MVAPGSDPRWQRLVLTFCGCGCQSLLFRCATVIATSKLVSQRPRLELVQARAVTRSVERNFVLVRRLAGCVVRGHVRCFDCTLRAKIDYFMKLVRQSAESDTKFIFFCFGCPPGGRRHGRGVVQSRSLRDASLWRALLMALAPVTA